MYNISLENKYLKMLIEVDENNIPFITYFGNETNFIKEKSNLVQLETNTYPHMGCHCFKMADSFFSTQAKYVSHDLLIKEGKQELIITLADECLSVEQHYILYDNAAGISSYNITKNISKSPIKLEHISSFYLYGFGNKNVIPSSKNLYIHYAHNSWYSEAQWCRHSFMDEGIYNGNEARTMKIWNLSNTGSWSTKDHLPMQIVEDAENSLLLLTQIENNGSWHYEIADNSNLYYLCASGPTFIYNQWVKELKPNDTFESVQVSVTLGDSFEKVIQEITKVRRNYIRKGYDYENLPIIFNDYMHALWDTQNEGLILPMVDTAAEVGAEEFCIDAGWFAPKSGWWEDVGEWKEYKDNFPHGGFVKVFDYIRSKGMRPGLWFEIENVGRKSPVASQLPDEYFFIANGTRANRFNRYCLNFANPKVFDYAFDLISESIDLYGLEYIKIDYNLDAGPGNEWNSDSLGDGLLKHNRTFIKWIQKLQEKYPNLTIENCGSGGNRMDYALLKVCDIQSTSDQISYQKYAYLSSNVLTACLPEQAAVWSYPVDCFAKELPSDEVVVMNMVNAMLGRIHLSSYIDKLPKNQFELIKEGLKCFKSITEFKKNSLPIYPNGISKFFDKEVVGGLINDKKIILCVWNTSNDNRNVKVNLSKYNIKDIKVIYPLSLPTKFDFDGKCLSVDFPVPYGGRVFEIELK